MTSSKEFSLYDAATLAQLDLKSKGASPSSSMEEADVDDVRDEADAIVEEAEEERANAATQREPRTTDMASPSVVNQWLDRANALNEIRMLLKEEIEQDSGEYFVAK
jgi:hypothetical protein